MNIVYLTAVLAIAALMSGCDEASRDTNTCAYILEDFFTCYSCTELDGAYCQSVGIGQGACIDDECVDCTTFTCLGVVGCSSHPRFAHNTNVGNECPRGCFSTCAP